MTVPRDSMNNDVSQIYFPLEACQEDIAIAWTINEIILVIILGDLELFEL